MSENNHPPPETQGSSAEPLPRWVTDPNCDLGPDTPAPRACSVDHKWPHDEKDRKADVYPRPKGGFLEYAGAVVRLVGIAGAGTARRRRKRDKIREWSRASRRRLLRTCLALDWSVLGSLVLVTLTYPGDGAADYIPHDGRVVHAHLRRLLKRWRREWGVPAGLWKLEFQRRGAPHLHFFLSMPAGASVVGLRSWVAQTWWEVVGSKNADHLRAGTGVDLWDGTPTRYAWKYVKGDPAKERQHQVPHNFSNVGRWWGLINLAPRWITVDLTAEGFVKARRVVRGWRRATGGYRLRVMNSAAGFWVFTHRGPVRALVDGVMRAATGGGTR